VVRTQYARSGSPIGGKTIYVFCEPDSSDLTIPFQVIGFACVSEIDVEALVVALDGPHQDLFAPLPCGTVSALRAGAGTPEDAIAYGRERVFEGKEGGPCRSGTASVNFTASLTK
jgi:hypothetical protein